MQYIGWTKELVKEMNEKIKSCVESRVKKTSLIRFLVVENTFNYDIESTETEAINVCLERPLLIGGKTRNDAEKEPRIKDLLEGIDFEEPVSLELDGVYVYGYIDKLFADYTYNSVKMPKVASEFGLYSCRSLFENSTLTKCTCTSKVQDSFYYKNYGWLFVADWENAFRNATIEYVDYAQTICLLEFFIAGGYSETATIYEALANRLINFDYKMTKGMLMKARSLKKCLFESMASNKAYQMFGWLTQYYAQSYKDCFKDAKIKNLSLRSGVKYLLKESLIEHADNVTLVYSDRDFGQTEDTLAHGLYKFSEGEMYKFDVIANYYMENTYYTTKDGNRVNLARFVAINKYFIDKKTNEMSVNALFNKDSRTYITSFKTFKKIANLENKPVVNYLLNMQFYNSDSVVYYKVGEIPGFVSFWGNFDEQYLIMIAKDKNVYITVVDAKELEADGRNR